MSPGSASRSRGRARRHGRSRRERRPTPPEAGQLRLREPSQMSENHSELVRNTLGVLVIAGLIAASFWILRPFLPAAIWATMIVVFTWPIMIRLQRLLWNRRAPAVAVMSLLLLVIFVLPFAAAASTIIINTERFVGWVQSLADFTLPPPPDWL